MVWPSSGRLTPETRGCFDRVFACALRPLALLAAAAARSGGGGYARAVPSFLAVTVTGSISLNGSISLELAFAGRVVIGHTVSWARGQDTKSEHMTSLPLAWPCHLRIHAACLRPMRATPLLQTSCHWAHQKRCMAPLQQSLVRLTVPRTVMRANLRPMKRRKSRTRSWSTVTKRRSETRGVSVMCVCPPPHVSFVPHSRATCRCAGEGGH